MIDWFMKLRIGNKIALITLIITLFFGIIAWVKKGTVEIKQSGTNNTIIQTGDNSPVYNKLSDEDISKLAEKIAKKMQKTSTFQAKTDNEFILEEITKLLTTKGPDLQEVANKLKQIKIDEAIELLVKIDDKRNKESVEIKLYLAAFLTYKDPQKSYDLLKQAINLDSTNIQALNQYGLLSMRFGYMQIAIDTFLSILDMSKTKKIKGVALGNLGLAYAGLGEVEKAIGYYDKALLISREIKDRQGEGSDLGNLGSAYFRLGEVEKAIGYYDKALLISREIKDRQGEGSHLGNLGSAYFRLGEVEKAIGYYDKAYEIFIEIKSPNAVQVKQWLDREQK